MNTCILRNKAFILIFFVFDSASVQAQEIKKLKDHNYWTVKNLSLDIGDSYCYNDSIQYCGKYGRLYTWSAAIKVCEHLGQGWHLPTSNEWINLLNHYGRAFQDSVNNGKKSFSRLLKQGKHRFNAMLGGNRNLDESYSRLEAHGF